MNTPQTEKPVRAGFSLIGLSAIALFIALPAQALTADRKPSATDPSGWVERCDRLEQSKEMDCLEKTRARMLEKFLRNDSLKESPKASTTPPPSHADERG